MHFRFRVLLFFVLAFLGNVFSQNLGVAAYYITVSNDTVFGMIEENSNVKNSLYCNFRVNETTPYKKLTPDLIKEYRIENGKYYVAKEVEIKQS